MNTTITTTYAHQGIAHRSEINFVIKDSEFDSVFFRGSEFDSVFLTGSEFELVFVKSVEFDPVFLTGSAFDSVFKDTNWISVVP